MNGPIELNPDQQSDVYSQLAKLYVLQNEIRQAAATLESAIGYRPNDVAARSMLATILMQLNQPGVALQHFEIVYQADPNFLRNLYFYSQALAYTAPPLQNTTKALELANRAVELAPKAPASYETLASIFAANKEYEKVADSAKKAIELHTANGNEPAAKRM